MLWTYNQSFHGKRMFSQSYIIDTVMHSDMLRNIDELFNDENPYLTARVIADNLQVSCPSVLDVWVPRALNKAQLVRRVLRSVREIEERCKKNVQN